jgi:hypothetical protein
LKHTCLSLKQIFFLFIGYFDLQKLILQTPQNNSTTKLWIMSFQPVSVRLGKVKESIEMVITPN